MAIGAYKIDGLDFFINYGGLVKKAPAELLKGPTTKEVVEHDFGDENGVEYFIAKRFWRDKEFTLPAIIVAASRAEYFTKSKALFDHLTSSGNRNLYIKEYDHTFQCFYLDNPRVDRLTRMADGRVICEHDLLFKCTDVFAGEEFEGSGGEVTVKDQLGNIVQVVQAPGEYQVIAFSGIKITRGNTGNKIIAKK